MQRLNSSYSLYFRYQRGKTGHVLDGRYKARLIEDDEPLRAMMGASPYAIGSESFIEKIHGDLSRRRTGTVKDADLMLPKDSMALSEIDRVVCTVFGVCPDVLKSYGSRAGTAKTVAVELAVCPAP